MSEPISVERLRHILTRVGLAVANIRAEKREIVIDLGTPKGSAVEARVFVVPLPSEKRFYYKTKQLGFYYVASKPDDKRLLDKVRLVIQVLSQIEDRFFHEIPLRECEVIARFERLFPFAIVASTVHPDGTLTTYVVVRLTNSCEEGVTLPSLPTFSDPTRPELQACLHKASRYFPGCQVILTDAKPTSRNRWEDCALLALNEKGIGAVQVVTSAVAFGEDSVVPALPPHPKLTFLVPIPSFEPEIYDIMTGIKGLLPLAISGIKNLIASGHRVVLNCVVGDLNVRSLPKFVASIPAQFGGKKIPDLQVSVMGYGLSCLATSRCHSLVRYEDIVPILRETVKLAEVLGISLAPIFSGIHSWIPLCFLSEREREEFKDHLIFSPEMVGYDDFSKPWVKAPGCLFCEADEYCLGVLNCYARTFGLAGLKPFRASPLKKVFPITEATLRLMSPLSKALAQANPIPQHCSITLSLISPKGLPSDQKAVSFSSFFSCLPPNFYRHHGRTVKVHSDVGRPLCWFLGAAQQSVYEASSPERNESLAFPEVCGSCALHEKCSGVSHDYLEVFGSSELRPLSLSSGETLDFKRLAMWLLLDRPHRGIEAWRLFRKDSFPDIPCLRPWTRLELHEGGTFGPCQSGYMREPFKAPQGATIEDLWFSREFERFRLDFLTRMETTCRDTCSVLLTKLATAERFFIRNGPKRALENQLKALEAAISGQISGDWFPTSICVAVTSFCNYDCLMCDCGEKGTLGDERGDAFWASIERYLDHGILVDVTGGEPLASPAFRRFIERVAHRHTSPFISIITNGSFLTQTWLSRLPVLPFISVTVSLNAASEKTYETVTRGIPWRKIRQNVERLLDARQTGKFSGDIIYSFVILRANIHEIEDFARMAIRDGVSLRYVLPEGNRNNQSILLSLESMETARVSLEKVAVLLEENGLAERATHVRSLERILRERIASRKLAPL